MCSSPGRFRGLPLAGVRRQERLLQHGAEAVDHRADQGLGLGVEGRELRDRCRRQATVGHHRFDVVGHDIGTWIADALAADHPGRVGRLAVAEAVIPGLTPSPPVFSPAAVNGKLWQTGSPSSTRNSSGAGGRLLGWQFATKAATATVIPAYAVGVYVDAITADPRALCASFA